jgi:hypothetical protein
MRRHAPFAFGVSLLVVGGPLLAADDANDQAIKKDRKR